MLIQIDVDSTLYDADKLFYQLAKEQGIKWPRNNNCWLPAEKIFREDGTPCGREDLVRIFRKAHSYEYVMQQKPYARSAETLGRIAAVPEVEIAYVSDRNEQQTGALRDWLEINGFLFSEDAHVQATKDKRHWMRERKPEIVVDDRVRTMMMARYELGSYVVSLEHAHNANLRGEVEHIYLAKKWSSYDNNGGWADEDSIDYILTEIVLPKALGRSLRKEATYA
jgi:hypothetical protein